MLRMQGIKFMLLIKKYTSYYVNYALNHIEKSLCIRKLLWENQGALKELLVHCHREIDFQRTLYEMFVLSLIKTKTAFD